MAQNPNYCRHCGEHGTFPDILPYAAYDHEDRHSRVYLHQGDCAWYWFKKFQAWIETEKEKASK